MLVPSHRDIARSVNEGKPIVLSRPRSDVARAFRSLADIYAGTPAIKRARKTFRRRG